VVPAGKAAGEKAGSGKAGAFMTLQLAPSPQSSKTLAFAPYAGIRSPTNKGAPAAKIHAPNVAASWPEHKSVKPESKPDRRKRRQRMTAI
jgi:hypothetical protein